MAMWWKKLAVRATAYFIGAALISALTIVTFLQQKADISKSLLVLHMNAFGRETLIIALLSALVSSLEHLVPGTRIKTRTLYHFCLGITVALIVLFLFLLSVGLWWPAPGSISVDSNIIARNIVDNNILGDYLFVISNFSILFLPLAGAWGMLVHKIENRFC